MIFHQYDDAVLDVRHDAALVDSLNDERRAAMIAFQTDFGKEFRAGGFYKNLTFALAHIHNFGGDVVNDDARTNAPFDG